MLIQCPECGKQISSYASACPNCGFPIPQVKKSEKVKITKNKKHPKLPNGFGSIKRITGKKERYGVYPPANKREFNDYGIPPTKTALCYVDDWYVGFYALLDYKNGVFDASKYTNKELKSVSNDNNVINKIIESWNNQNRIYTNNITFAEIYERFYEDKFISSKKEFSKASIYAANAAYKNVSQLHDMPFAFIVTDDLQKALDECDLKHASLELIVNLYKGMYAYAIKNDIVDKDYSKYVKISISDDDEKGIPFSEEELKILWKDSKNKITQKILIMIYTGFRIAAFESIKINIEEQYLQGGVKTKSAKNRIVPIHPGISDFVEIDTFDKFSKVTFRNAYFTNKLEQLGILYTSSGKKHTPHDCRHTFSWLCDKYKVDNISKHMLMGHVVKDADVEEKKYSHRTIEQLREEINKIDISEYL